MLAAKGLAKLLEEAGELCQIAGKKIAFFDTDIHPDGKGSMYARMEDEMADVIAAIAIVAELHSLDIDHIMGRADKEARILS